MQGIILTPAASAPLTVQQQSSQDDIEPQEVVDKDQTLTSTDFFRDFAHGTGIDQNALEDVFYFHDGAPGLNVPARKLGSSRAIQTRSVTLALTAAYHFGVNDKADRVSAIRRECERLRCIDASNFTRHLGSTKGVNFTGPRTAKELKTKPDTLTELKELIASIRGSEE